MQETLRHKEAFEYYLSLGEKRSCTEVARQFAVSRTSVSKWNREFGWRDRLKVREAKIGAKVEAANDNTLASIKKKLLKSWTAAADRWVERFDGDQITPETYKDMEIVTKNLLLILGGATERVEIVTFASEIAELARKTITKPQDLEAFVRGVRTLASTGSSLN